MALARRNVAAGGAPRAPSSVVPRNCLFDGWSFWKAVCSPTPRWGLVFAEDMWNPAMTTLMSTGHCSEGFLPAVKYAKIFDCPQKTWKPCSTFRLSRCQSILLNNYPKDHFSAVWLWLQYKAIAQFLSLFVYFFVCSFSRNVGLCPTCPSLQSLI